MYSDFKVFKNHRFSFLKSWKPWTRLTSLKKYKRFSPAYHFYELNHKLVLSFTKAVDARLCSSSYNSTSFNRWGQRQVWNLKMASGFKSIRRFIPHKKKNSNYMELFGPNVGLISNCRTSLNQILKKWWARRRGAMP